MTQRDDGGPAYPVNEYYPSSEGMSLRDWFAGQALGHLIRRCVSAEDWANLPFTAYEIANVMLEARKK